MILVPVQYSGNRTKVAVRARANGYMRNLLLRELQAGVEARPLVLGEQRPRRVLKPRLVPELNCILEAMGKDGEEAFQMA